jgi:hypothetical protein
MKAIVFSISSLVMSVRLSDLLPAFPSFRLWRQPVPVGELSQKAPGGQQRGLKPCAARARNKNWI